jgi:hypothetical protein
MPSGESLSLELPEPSGDAFRVHVDPECVRELRAARGNGTPRRCWSLANDPDWSVVGELSLMAAGFEDGAVLAVAALRPREAGGHDADVLEGVVVSPEGDAARMDEVLLSTEYGPDGKARRLGLELYEGVDGPPTRVAADRLASTEPAAGDERTEVSTWSLRMAGTPGGGTYELIRPG